MRIFMCLFLVLGIILFKALQPVQADVIALQPGPGEGKDIWTTNVYSHAPGGGGPGGGIDNEWLEVGGWGDLYYTLIEFDLTNLPDVALSAKIELFVGKSKGNGNAEMYLDRITEFWDWTIQGTGSDLERLWWADRPLATQWDPNLLTSPIVGQWYSIDITGLYNAWQNGTYNNYGVQLRPFSTNNRWNEFYSSDYLDAPALRPKLVVEVSTLSLSFPLVGYTPYNVNVGAVFDHSVPDGFHKKDGIVRAYNGEEGKCQNGAAKYEKNGSISYFEGNILIKKCEKIGKGKGVWGYKNESGTVFLNGVINYPPPDNDFLWYDGHPGYDYSVGDGGLVQATADGKLYKAKKDSVNGGGWIKYHTFYIDHENGYSSWYLHCKNLEPAIESEIEQNGFASVYKGQVIAATGNKGVKGYHLHFEVRKGGYDHENVIDPYKEGLWE
jgi:hypothetical protein